MIAVHRVSWEQGAWVILVNVQTGVYQLISYPLRITHLPYSDDPTVQQALGALGIYLITRHMRRGAIPPHGTVVNGQRFLQTCDQIAASDRGSWCPPIEKSLKPLAIANVSHVF
ncbi:MAG: hypothetical protein M1499_06440 [Firmicutes bacterium]|nr:hypothetical protein [Bacillota bacterium]